MGKLLEQCSSHTPATCEALCESESDCAAFTIDVNSNNGCCVLYSQSPLSASIDDDACCECYDMSGNQASEGFRSEETTSETSGYSPVTIVAAAIVAVLLLIAGSARWHKYVDLHDAELKGTPEDDVEMAVEQSKVVGAAPEVTVE